MFLITGRMIGWTSARTRYRLATSGQFPMNELYTTIDGAALVRPFFVTNSEQRGIERGGLPTLHSLRELMTGGPLLSAFREVGTDLVVKTCETGTVQVNSRFIF